MPTRGDGVFTFEIPTADLAKGLRTTKRNPRNVKFLTECKGAVALDNVLQVLSDESAKLINSIAITDGFPFPQLFIGTNLIIVCGKTKIYELVGDTLQEMLTATGGILWSVVDYQDYVYASNSVVVAVRDALTRKWSVDASGLPTAGAACDFNGQLVIGSPNVPLSMPPVPLKLIESEPIIIEVSTSGTYV